tara:strand:+ start:330 stop:548 length:219 start_codon:yes stop_codon:yes gene_type:complete
MKIAFLGQRGEYLWPVWVREGEDLCFHDLVSMHGLMQELEFMMKARRDVHSRMGEKALTWGYQIWRRDGTPE